MTVLYDDDVHLAVKLKDVPNRIMIFRREESGRQQFVHALAGRNWSQEDIESEINDLTSDNILRKLT